MRNVRKWLPLLVGCAAIGCTAEVPISSVQNFNVAVEGHGARLTWNAATEPATSLLVERRSAGGRYQRMSSLAIESIEFLDEEPMAGPISYRVLAFSDDDPLTGTYSQELTLSMP